VRGETRLTATPHRTVTYTGVSVDVVTP
jgi:hypothetical protein